LDRLEDVTSIRDSENLYRIRKDEFDWLKIGQPAGVAAFGARDLNDLNQRLAVFRSTVGTLARDYAQTLVEITSDLGEPFSADVRAVDWGAIIEVLDDHEKKVPGNDLEMLDRFIEDDLNKLQTGTCSDQLQKSVKSSQYDQSNFFKKKRHEAAAAMLRHCKSLVRNLTIEGYVKLQRRFAEKLAGQFPFAGAAIQAEVNTGDVVEFYRMFDRYSSAFTVLLDSSSGQQPDLFGKDTEDVKRFIQQVERARPLFKNLLTSEDENPELVLDLRFRFRANEENEVNGNQIIEWRSLVGDAKIGHRDSKQTAQWKTNDGMSMCFRWAMNALFTPVRDQRDDNARVNGQTVCYKYDGRWALMRMLKSHESTPADRGRRTFLRPHTLRFETETGPSSSGSSSASLLVNDTRVYVRVEAFIPGAKQAMKLPEFPRRAPELGAEFLRKNGLVATGGGKEL